MFQIIGVNDYRKYFQKDKMQKKLSCKLEIVEYPKINLITQFSTL